MSLSKWSLLIFLKEYLVGLKVHVISSSVIFKENWRKYVTRPLHDAFPAIEFVCFVSCASLVSYKAKQKIENVVFVDYEGYKSMFS